ncbi:MAG: hypothetical protein QOG18_1685 [Microbacteriaceae bacterium]|nr:hypothetical protein [Microbacteriaceae bacterium]
MQWWNNFVDWFNSTEGWRLISGAIIPFLAIVVAGIIAAGIGRASTRRVIALSDRDARIASVTALLSAARRAAVWNTLSTGEQQHVDQLTTEAEIRLRLLAMPGASLASEWTAHEIAEMKKNSVSFSFQAEQSLLIVRDRLIEWQGRPNRAKRLFKNDLDSWAYESSLSDQDLVHQQQAWSAQQAAANAAQPAAPALSSSSTATTPIAAPASASPSASSTSTAPASPQTAFTPGRFTRPAAVSAPGGSGSTTPAGAVSPAPHTSAPYTPASAGSEGRTDAPSDTSDGIMFARPVTASEASKRIDPPQDDITP